MDMFNRHCNCNDNTVASAVYQNMQSTVSPFVIQTVTGNCLVMFELCFFSMLRTAESVLLPASYHIFVAVLKIGL